MVHDLMCQFEMIAGEFKLISRGNKMWDGWTYRHTVKLVNSDH